MLSRFYRPSLGLLTDFYELTMAYGYWKKGAGEREAAFHLFFRKPPFGGGFVVAAGLEYVVDFVSNFSFDRDDLSYLSSLKGKSGEPVFEEEFLRYLEGLRLTCNLDAVPEGTAAFPFEPLLRVTGPIVQCQLLESALLNIVNFQTLIATKSARVCMAAQGEPVLEFGLRRAQGVDGALTASRASYIGGCAATSNVLAGRVFGIPVKGTHAHSWIMFFENELEAFEAYADVFPDNCIFLVDTYATLEGTRQAVEVAKRLRERGYEVAGIRLDSGDLASLSIQARKILDEAGFPDAFIVGSNDLDEYAISSLKKRGAAIGVWGVGTRLVTAYDEPALGGVYKVTAVREPDKEWRYRLKLSEEEDKISNPGLLQVRRFERRGSFCSDILYEELLGMSGDGPVLGMEDPGKEWRAPADAHGVDLLLPVIRGGDVVYGAPSLQSVRKRTQTQLAKLPPEMQGLAPQGTYPVGLDSRLYRLKEELTRRAGRGGDLGN